MENCIKDLVSGILFGSFLWMIKRSSRWGDSHDSVPTVYGTTVGYHYFLSIECHSFSQFNYVFGEGEKN